MGLVHGTAFFVSKVLSAVKGGFRTELMKRDKFPGAFHYYKCIFVHIPKSAGTSVCKAIFGYQIGHRTYADYVMNSPANLDHYFKFSFVRNPWDRVLSAYLYLRDHSDSSTPEDDEWAESNLRSYCDFNEFVQEWVNNENILQKVHFIPQYKFISDENGVIKMDFVGRFEDLTNDFKYITSIIGQTERNLPSTNVTSHQHYSHFYNDESIEIIRNVYSKDITTFNYVFDDKRQRNSNMDNG